MPAAALNIISGITEYTSRIELKNVFGQFGEVTACWLPPMDHRERGAYVKFGSTRAAELAVAAAGAGRVYLDGMRLEVEWRQASNRTEDTRDFKAQGSNLMTSRDLMRAAMKERQSAKKPARDRRGGRERSRDRSRDGSNDRDRRRSRSRGGRKKSRGRSRSGKRKSRSRSRGKPRDKSEDEPKAAPPALEDKADTSTRCVI